jgi:hypothetical protein
MRSVRSPAHLRLSFRLVSSLRLFFLVAKQHAVVSDVVADAFLQEPVGRAFASKGARKVFDYKGDDVTQFGTIVQIGTAKRTAKIVVENSGKESPNRNVVLEQTGHVLDGVVGDVGVLAVG